MTFAESKYWVTLENVDQLITPEFFQKPCTTGVIDETSAHWRYYCRTGNIWQLLHQKDGQIEPQITPSRVDKKKAKGKGDERDKKKNDNSTKGNRVCAVSILSFSTVSGII